MKKSAGLLLYRKKGKAIEVLLAHPGGPFWKNRDDGAWSIPKGEFTEKENALEAARREFREETGMQAEGDFLALAPIKQKSGKTVYAWALEKDIDPARIKSNEFEMEWPPRSGKRIMVPEMDRCEWFTPAMAKQKILPGQAGLVDELLAKVYTAGNGFYAGDIKLHDMKKTGEDQPPKTSPSRDDLANLAGKKTKADQDTDYQDTKKVKDGKKGGVKK